MTCLSKIELDETGLAAPSPELEQERRVAVFDLQESNCFEVKGAAPGPYALRLGAEAGRIVLHWTAPDGETGTFRLSLGPLDQAVKDYRALCDTYVEAVRTLPPARIEQIDTARRDIHDEAARQLRARLSDHVSVDNATARRLFTLICTIGTRD
ncbi:Uncharacterized protein, UPF0262 family [Palleronia marisminoris]|uniref:Uncharacterized protein n=1 Tax=Palleronia marisminoris TaxID=315423 RepID=A0A1Y5TD51_9RHOB|nr:UPF0262 family protein [Palleronia marisminoris]SFH32278.1 Uncharacterized protein, UPF0262 family [Palleronia marisminoris]SLN61273.1 hypothetical protein PAM7066_03053 [Palleronia marisminoris]